jgi:glutathione synthase/RimK-type ligase-like ATP-grasp enzyme
VTCAELPDGEEAPLLDAALRAHGLEPVWATWDDREVDWSRFELVLVRSAWDYAERWTEFLRWAEARPRLENPLSVLRFGVDKERYLVALATAKVPVMPTTFVHPGDLFRPPATPFVVKPAISAGGRRSARFDPDDEASALLVAEIVDRGETAMVQPFLSGVAESSLVYLDGAYSHSLSRRAELPRGRAEDVLYLAEELGPYESTPAERHVAEAALGLAPALPLYARVDLLGGLLLELELVEPSLYLAYGEGSADRLAAAVAAGLES